MTRSPGQVRTPRGYAVTKRTIDLGVCLIALPILLPVGLLCALLIRLESPGPILFAQQRTGQHGVRFPMWKFRTMVRNAEELKASLQHLNILPAPDFKIPNDPRVTRVGKFLRKTSLDELPQILNVIRGQMSIVGPRPTSFAASSPARSDSTLSARRTTSFGTGWPAASRRFASRSRMSSRRVVAVKAGRGPRHGARRCCCRSASGRLGWRQSGSGGWPRWPVSRWPMQLRPSPRWRRARSA